MSLQVPQLPRLLTLTLALSLAAPSAHAGGSPTFRSLGSLPGTNASWGYGVSDDGSWVVGRSGTNFYYGNSSHAYSWHSSDNSMTDLTPLDPDSTAYGISADGTMVVGVRHTGGGQTHSFACDTLGTPQNSGGGGADELYAVSSTGSSYVGYEMSGGNPGTPHAVRWTADTRWQTIDNSSMTASRAYATSADGSVIVGQATFSGIGSRAFVWTSANGAVNIGSTALAGPSSEARGVSADGTIVIGTSGGRAFRWTSSGGMQLLDLPANASSSTAYGISADGSTIVGTFSIAGQTRTRGFVWRASTGTQDMQTLLASVIPAGWQIFEARAVTPDGQTIVGTAWNALNEPEAFIATVPVCIEATIAQQPVSITAAPGHSASMSVTPAGTGPFSYQWRKDGTELTGATSSTLLIPIATASDAGSYDCLVSNACTAVPTLSDPAALLVRCTADINNSGALSVQDIFDFLNAYFGNTQAGDFNNSGAITVQDLFDFLAAYFAGCN